MNIALRAMLLVGALVTLVYFLSRIRKKQLQIPYAISWGIFSAMLLLLGIFPGIISWLSIRIGFQSPANFVYLVVIFLLILKLFSSTVRLSVMDRQITDMAQHIALQENALENGKQDERVNPGHMPKETSKEKPL